MTDPDTDDLPDADYQRLAEFRHGLRAFLRFSEEAARAEGLTPNQHQLLLAVRGWGGDSGPTVSHLAEQLQLKLHSTGELAHRAAAAGLVRLDADPADHRRQVVTLTPAGRRKLRALTLAHRTELRSVRHHFEQVLQLLDEPVDP